MPPKPKPAFGAPKAKDSTKQRLRFVEYYMACADPEVAYQQAGYECKTPASLRVASRRLLNSDFVQAEIRRRVDEEGFMEPLEVKGKEADMKPLIANRRERQEFLTATMRDPGVAMKDRLKACEILAKTQGDFADVVAVIAPAEIRAAVADVLGISSGTIDITPRDPDADP